MEESREWRPQHLDHNTGTATVLARGCRSPGCRRRLPVTTADQEMGLRDDLLPSGDMKGRRYSDTLKDVYSFNPAIVPQALAVDNVFGGELMNAGWRGR